MDFPCCQYVGSMVTQDIELQPSGRAGVRKTEQGLYEVPYLALSSAPCPELFPVTSARGGDHGKCPWL
jgi:hypothetical protein